MHFMRVYSYKYLMFNGLNLMMLNKVLELFKNNP